MDDSDDDARYPPNPRRHQLSSIHRRPKAPFPSHRTHAGVSDNSDEDSVEEDNRDFHHLRGSHEPRDDEKIDASGASSSESRGKRRRLDKLALGFEFAPRSKRAPLPRSPADWSEESTLVLLDAWGDLFVQNGRKSIRSDEWSGVSKKVSQSSRTPRSETQCRNRVDTLKKKYKKEKARMAGAANPTSVWIYFDKMDTLLSAPAPLSTLAPPEQQTPRLQFGVDAGEYVFRSNGHTPGDSPLEDDVEEDDDESDGLPPARRTKSLGDLGSSSFRILAESIQKFGEIYEKVEINKRQQLAELDRMRKDFQRDLEAQKRQILEKAQAEIARIRQEEGEDDDEVENEDVEGDGGEEEDEM